MRHRLVVAFSNPPEGVTPEQLADAQLYIDGGNVLVDHGDQAHLDAGFTEEQVDQDQGRPRRPT